MPTVIGVNQVSGKLPPKSKWYQDLGRIAGKTTDQILSAYLASQGGAGGVFQSPQQKQITQSQLDLQAAQAANQNAQAGAYNSGQIMIDPATGQPTVVPKVNTSVDFQSAPSGGFAGGFQGSQAAPQSASPVPSSASAGAGGVMSDSFLLDAKAKAEGGDPNSIAFLNSLRAYIGAQ